MCDVIQYNIILLASHHTVVSLQSISALNTTELLDDSWWHGGWHWDFSNQIVL